MTDVPHPLRFRLRGGRNVHAVRFTPGSPPFAACGQIVADADERQHDGAAITCVSCVTALQRSSA